MKEVHFGYENSLNPIGSFEGIGTGKGLHGPVVGEYIDVISLSGEEYLISKVEVKKDIQGSDYQYDVRRALADIYPDGSGILFLDQEQSEMCLRVSAMLNSAQGKECLDKGLTVREICEAHMAPFSFECVTRANTVLATSILHEIFDVKKRRIASCHRSFSDMVEQMEYLMNNGTVSIDEEKNNKVF